MPLPSMKPQCQQLEGFWILAGTSRKFSGRTQFRKYQVCAAPEASPFLEAMSRPASLRGFCRATRISRRPCLNRHIPPLAYIRKPRPLGPGVFDSRLVQGSNFCWAHFRSTKPLSIRSFCQLVQRPQLLLRCNLLDNAG